MSDPLKQETREKKPETAEARAGGDNRDRYRLEAARRSLHRVGRALNDTEATLGRARAALERSRELLDRLDGSEPPAREGAEYDAAQAVQRLEGKEVDRGS